MRDFPHNGFDTVEYDDKFKNLKHVWENIQKVEAISEQDRRPFWLVLAEVILHTNEDQWDQEISSAADRFGIKNLKGMLKTFTGTLRGLSSSYKSKFQDQLRADLVPFRNPSPAQAVEFGSPVEDISVAKRAEVKTEEMPEVEDNVDKLYDQFYERVLTDEAKKEYDNLSSEQKALFEKRIKGLIKDVFCVTGQFIVQGSPKVDLYIHPDIELKGLQEKINQALPNEYKYLKDKGAAYKQEPAHQVFPHPTNPNLVVLNFVIYESMYDKTGRPGGNQKFTVVMNKNNPTLQKVVYGQEKPDDFALDLFRVGLLRSNVDNLKNSVSKVEYFPQRVVDYSGKSLAVWDEDGISGYVRYNNEHGSDDFLRTLKNRGQFEVLPEGASTGSLNGCVVNSPKKPNTKFYDYYNSKK